eukprot:jgi/Mesvir1/15232/Mv06458-RA.1
MLAGTVEYMCDFLEVAVLQILYVRGLYPRELFQRRKKYGVPVQQSRHPLLSEYVRDATAHLRDPLEKGLVQKVAVLLYKEEAVGRVPVERFVFYLSVDAEQPPPSLGDLEHSLKAFLLKIGICDAMIAPLPTGCRWELVTYVHDREVPGTESFWAEAEKADIPDVTKTIIPLKSMETPAVRMQLVVEQA